MNIEGRIRQAEKKLNVNQDVIIVRLINYHDGPLPPEQRYGNLIVRHVNHKYVHKEEVQQ